MATLNGKKMTAAQYTALKKKWKKEDRAFWKTEASKIRTQISGLKKRLPAAKKLPIKVKATSIQMRINELETQLKRISKR